MTSHLSIPLSVRTPLRRRLSSHILLLRLVRLCRRHIQPLINTLRNRLNLRPQLLLNLVQIKPVLVRDEVDGEPQVSKPARAADAVEVSLAVLGKVKVDDDVDGLDVDAAGEEVGADEVAADAVSKVVEDAVPVGLEHFGV